MSGRDPRRFRCDFHGTREEATARPEFLFRECSTSLEIAVVPVAAPFDVMSEATLMSILESSGNRTGG